MRLSSICVVSYYESNRVQQVIQGWEKGLLDMCVRYETVLQVILLIVSLWIDWRDSDPDHPKFNGCVKRVSL